MAINAYRLLRAWGIDPRLFVVALRNVGSVMAHRRQYDAQSASFEGSTRFPVTSLYPVFADRELPSGEAKGHYFHQDLFVAREVYRRQPRRHIDVGSSVYGFVSHVASFREVEIIDIRPLESKVAGITYIRRDLMQQDESFHAVTDSLSCLHALEHFGLGRYGDPVDYHGWSKGLANLSDMLTSRGTLYLSIPTGVRQRVEFNAHRVFALPTIRNAVLANFEIEQLAFVDDAGDLAVGLDPYSEAAERSFDAQYGCSIWVLVKR